MSAMKGPEGSSSFGYKSKYKTGETSSFEKEEFVVGFTEYSKNLKLLDQLSQLRYKKPFIFLNSSQKEEIWQESKNINEKQHTNSNSKSQGDSFIHRFFRNVRRLFGAKR